MAESLEREIAGLRSLLSSERDPDGRAFVPLADAYRRSRDFDRALDVLKTGLERHPTLASAHVVSAWVHRDRGDRDTARTSWERVLELDDENIEALRGMGTLLLESGRIDEARPFLERVRSFDPDDADVQGYLAEIGRRAAAPPPPIEPTHQAELETEPAAADSDLPPPVFAPSEMELETREAEPALADELEGLDKELAALIDQELAGFTEEPITLTEEPIAVVGESSPLSDWELTPEPPPSAEESSVEAEPAASSGAEAEEPLVLAAAAEALSPEEEPLVLAAGAEALLAGETLEVRTERNGEADEEVEPEELPATRTLAELFARQGLHARAIEVYEKLVAGSPDDEALRRRLRELRDQSRPTYTPHRVHAEDTEEIARAWGAVEGPPTVSPFGWTPEEPRTERVKEPGAPISSYFSRLLSWEPGAPPESAAPSTVETPEPAATDVDVPAPPPEVFQVAAEPEVLSIVEGPWSAPAQVAEQPEPVGEESPVDPMGVLGTLEALEAEAAAAPELPESFGALELLPREEPFAPAIDDDDDEPAWVAAILESGHAPPTPHEEAALPSIVPIDSLAPDRFAADGSPRVAEVVPISSLAPAVVSISSLAPDAVPIESLAPDTGPIRDTSTIRF